MYLFKGEKKTHHFISSSTVLTPNPCSQGRSKEKNLGGANYKLKGPSKIIVTFIKYLQGRGISLSPPLHVATR
jgi:hypothetical protein